MRISKGALFLAIAGAALVACGETTDDVVTPDAQPTIDGAVSIDAATGIDAATSLDASVAADGAPTDATAALDGKAPDAAPKDDANVLAGGEVCGNAVDVTSGGTFAGTTATFADDLSPPAGNGCPAGGIGSGNDVVYFVRPVAETTYKVTVFPEMSFDPMLYVTDLCNFSNGCVAGTVLNGPGKLESVTFTAGAGQRLHIVVDGEVVSSGSYTISISIQ